MRLNYLDYLKTGYGWDPNNASALVVSYGDQSIYPPDLFLDPIDIFVEFEASVSAEYYGFRLNLAVRNISGISCKHIMWLLGGYGGYVGMIN